MPLFLWVQGGLQVRTTDPVFAPLSAWPLRVKTKVFVAGPCSVESEQQIYNTATQLAEHDVTLIRGGIWKPRTRPNQFEGVGSRGLSWLRNAGNAVGLPVATEVATPYHVEQCLDAGIDVLWIGARTTTSPFAVEELANALRGVEIPVMMKNPMSPDLDLWIGAIERLARVGVKRLMAIHRGFSTGRRTCYRNNPIWRIPIELRRRIPGLPLLCDPSHVCGNPLMIPAVAQAAIDFLFDGLMIEVHDAPAEAWSDAQQQLTVAEYGRLIRELRYATTAPVADTPPAIGALRKEIDDIDCALVRLLASRMACAERIGACKRSHNLSLFQPERWDHVLEERVRISLEYNLSETFVRDLFEHIHEEALNVQRDAVAAGFADGALVQSRSV